MSAKPSKCLEIEPDLVAAATGEAEPAAVRRVQEHISPCTSCREAFQRYRVIEGLVGELKGASPPSADIARARGHLESRLADLRSRLVMYGVFTSPLGRLLIARSEQGVLLVEYLAAGSTLRGSRLSRLPGLEVVEDGAEIEAVYRELLEYLEGSRTRFEWPLDLRLARSQFHRAVLDATSKIPYGAVVSYTGMAWKLSKLGKSATCRGVAQALRWNPLPIVVPCHRIIGASGSLTGYAGKRIDLKQQLLAAEGIPVVKTGRDFQIARQAMYVRYPGDEAYCLPTCRSLASLTPARLTLFGLRERAEAAGLRPCTDCRPDLRPLSR